MGPLLRTPSMQPPGGTSLAPVAPIGLVSRAPRLAPLWGPAAAPLPPSCVVAISICLSSVIHGDRACGTNSGITRVWSPYSPVTGGSTPSSHHHQAQQPQGGLWRLGGGPSADPGPGRPPTPVAGAAGPRSKCRGLLPTTRRGAGASRTPCPLPGRRPAGGQTGGFWGLRSQKTAVLPCDSLKVAGRTDAGL